MTERIETGKSICNQRLFTQISPVFLHYLLDELFPDIFAKFAKLGCFGWATCPCTRHLTLELQCNYLDDQ